MMFFPLVKGMWCAANIIKSRLERWIGNGKNIRILKDECVEGGAPKLRRRHEVEMLDHNQEPYKLAELMSEEK